MGLITVLGPDGAGKTTLANNLASTIQDCRYRYLGHNPNKRHYRIGSRLIRIAEKLSLPGWLMKALLIYMNDWFDAHDKGLMATDRYVYDHVVLARLNRRPIRAWFHRWLCRLFPRPQVVILLMGDAKVIAARKGELSTDQTLQYMKLYEQELARYKIEPIKLDSSSYDQQQLMELLHEHGIC